ncbi:MAG: SDR family NAD(P)-dependent oxidoreductase [Proteobacteria bacterium]|nr:SDR family NAD(P)-dependent oxidoreductase [Pseudomonadota bacterium]
MTKPAEMPMWMKVVVFYGRFAPSFTAVGYVARGLPLRPLHASFKGQTWLVTGATGGIGKGIALGAAQRGATVLAVGRQESTLATLRNEGGAGIVPLQFDLGLVAANLALADEVKRRGGKLEVLVNNIGMLDHTHRLNPEGFEGTYALNLLCHFALTETLTDAGVLDGGIIINMASGGLYNTALSLRRLEQKPERYSGVMAYAAHKRAQLALAERWTRPERRLVSYTMHPGWVATQGVSTALPDLERHLGRALRTPAQGGDTALWLAAKRPAPVPGALWFDRAPRAAHAYESTRKPEVEPDAIYAKLTADVAKVRSAAGSA